MALLISLTCILYMVRLHGVPCRSEPQPKRSARSAAGAHGARPRVAASSSSSSTRPCLRSKSCGVAAPVRCFGVSVFQRRAASAQPPPRMSDRPAPAVKPSGGPAPEAIVGKVAETDAQHRKRHPRFRSDCPRCQYLKYGPQWEKHYGSYRSEVQGQRAATVWLAPRPTHFGGSWALGCTFCSHWAQRQAGRKAAARAAGVVLPKRGRGARDGQTKWARFEIRSLTQVAMRGVSQHANTLMHRKATRAYFTPEL